MTATLTPAQILGLPEPPAHGRLVSMQSLRNAPEQDWLVEHVIPATGVGQLYGKSYTGKSYVALDLAQRIVNGEPDWFGHTINRPGPVIYVLMEGLFDWAARVDAWLANHPESTDDGLWILPEEAVDLCDKESIKRLGQEARSIGPRLLIIDTQALATPGTEENSNTDMGKMIGLLKRLSKALDCPIMLVHHTGYDDSHARGASAVFAGMDFVFKVVEGGMAVEKVKGYKPVKEQSFQIKPHGESAYADPIRHHGKAVQGPSERILTLLRAEPNQLTKRQVLEHLGGGRSVRSAFESLQYEGEIESIRIDRVEGDRKQRREVWSELTLELVWAGDEPTEEAYPGWDPDVETYLEWESRTL